MYEENCYNNHSINNNLEIRARGLSNNQMLESSVCCHSKQTSALFLSESSFVDGEEKLHTIAFYFMKMRLRSFRTEREVISAQRTGQTISAAELNKKKNELMKH